MLAGLLMRARFYLAALGAVLVGLAVSFLRGYSAGRKRMQERIRKADVERANREADVLLRQRKADREARRGGADKMIDDMERGDF